MIKIVKLFTSLVQRIQWTVAIWELKASFLCVYLQFIKKMVHNSKDVKSRVNKPCQNDWAVVARPCSSLCMVLHCHHGVQSKAGKMDGCPGPRTIVHNSKDVNSRPGFLVGSRIDLIISDSFDQTLFNILNTF